MSDRDSEAGMEENTETINGPGGKSKSTSTPGVINTGNTGLGGTGFSTLYNTGPPLVNNPDRPLVNSMETPLVHIQADLEVTPVRL